MFGLLNRVVSSKSLKGVKDERKGTVTVLLNDGQVLEFPRRLKCSGLLASHPNHSVCHAASLVLHQQVKMLTPDAYMEPGEIYILVPQPAGSGKGKKASRGYSESSSLLQEGGGSSPVKFVISKQYLARILAEGDASRPPLTRSETNAWKVQPRPLVVRRAKSNNWSGPLDSIAEVAS